MVVTSILVLVKSIVVVLTSIFVVSTSIPLTLARIFVVSTSISAPLNHPLPPCCVECRNIENQVPKDLRFFRGSVRIWKGLGPPIGTKDRY